MSKTRLIPAIVVFLFGLSCFSQALAQQTPELAAESEAYTASTASTKAEPQMIMDKIGKGCALLGKEGKAAFPKFMGKGSEFLFAGTYIWIHDLKGKMLMHPIKYNMVGNDLLGLKDRKGKRFFAAMNQVVEEKGEGWVSYDWQKPGEKNFYPKISFIKKCKTADGDEVVLGCGAFDLEESVKKMGVEIK